MSTRMKKLLIIHFKVILTLIPSQAMTALVVCTWQTDDNRYWNDGLTSDSPGSSGRATVLLLRAPGGSRGRVSVLLAGLSGGRGPLLRSASPVPLPRSVTMVTTHSANTRTVSSPVTYRGLKKNTGKRRQTRSALRRLFRSDHRPPAPSVAAPLRLKTRPNTRW